MEMVPFNDPVHMRFYNIMTNNCIQLFEFNGVETTIADFSKQLRKYLAKVQHPSDKFIELFKSAVKSEKQRQLVKPEDYPYSEDDVDKNTHTVKYIRTYTGGTIRLTTVKSIKQLSRFEMSKEELDKLVAFEYEWDAIVKEIEAQESDANAINRNLLEGKYS